MDMRGFGVRRAGSFSTMLGLRGFTLIELLIVVSIIAILSAIAVPNFLEAQTRSKVARTQSDQRTLATALETYYVDTNRFPLRTKVPRSQIQLGWPDTDNRAYEMRWFTTPISYLTSLPVDIFDRKVDSPDNVIDYYDPLIVAQLSGEVKNPLAGGEGYDTYFNQGKSPIFTNGWMLFSVGPDGIFGTGVNRGGNYPERPTDITWDQEYDPTNGTVSEGSVTRFHKSGANATQVFHPAK
jgi:general secretion pathway protein G